MWHGHLTTAPSALQTAAAPAIMGLILTPLIMYLVYPPTVKSTPEAPAVRASRSRALAGAGWDAGSFCVPAGKPSRRRRRMLPALARQKEHSSSNSIPALDSWRRRS